VAAQYAFRFNLGERDGTEMRKLKTRAVAQMGKFDMAAVRSYFDKPCNVAPLKQSTLRSSALAA